MPERGKITLNSLVFEDTGGNTKRISVNISDNVIDFGDLEIKGGSFSTNGEDGTIDTFSIEVAGSGYSAGDTGDIFPKTGNGSGGSFEIVSVNGSGDMDVTNGGDGYRVGDLVYVGSEVSGETRGEIKITALD